LAAKHHAKMLANWIAKPDAKDNAKKPARVLIKVVGHAIRAKQPVNHHAKMLANWIAKPDAKDNAKKPARVLIKDKFKGENINEN
jgi:hypothetical protein